MRKRKMPIKGTRAFDQAVEAEVRVRLRKEGDAAFDEAVGDEWLVRLLYGPDGSPSLADDNAGRVRKAPISGPSSGNRGVLFDENGRPVRLPGSETFLEFGIGDPASLADYNARRAVGANSDFEDAVRARLAASGNTEFEDAVRARLRQNDVGERSSADMIDKGRSPGFEKAAEALLLERYENDPYLQGLTPARFEKEVRARLRKEMKKIASGDIPAEFEDEVRARLHENNLRERSSADMIDKDRSTGFQKASVAWMRQTPDGRESYWVEKNRYLNSLLDNLTDDEGNLRNELNRATFAELNKQLVESEDRLKRLDRKVKTRPDPEKAAAEEDQDQTTDDKPITDETPPGGGIGAGSTFDQEIAAGPNAPLFNNAWFGSELESNYLYRVSDERTGPGSDEFDQRLIDGWKARNPGKPLSKAMLSLEQRLKYDPESSLKEGLYTTSNLGDPRERGKGFVRDLQKEFAALNLYGESTYNVGDFDGRTAELWQFLLGDANEKGLDWRETLNRWKTNPPDLDGGGGGGRIPNPIEVTNPDDIRSEARTVSRNLTGQMRPGFDESMVGGFQGSEIAAQQAYNNEAIAGGAGVVTDSATPATYSEAQLRANSGPEVGAYAALGAFNQILQDMGLGG